MGACLRYWIWPFGNDSSQFSKPIRGGGLEDDALASVEGVAARTRALEESMRLLYVGCTRAKQKLVFAHRPNKYAWLKQIAEIDVLLDPTLDDGEHTLDNFETTYVRRRLQPAVAEGILGDQLASRWFADSKVDQTELRKRFDSPSSVKPTGKVALRIKELAGQCLFPSGSKEEDYAAIGDATHTYLGSIPSMQGLSESQKIVIAERCISGFGVTGKITPQMLVYSGERFCKWVCDEYPGAKWPTEVPVIGSRDAGGNWRGAIDLALVLTDARLVVIDHKSASIRRTYCEEKAQTYVGQLDAYEEVLRGHGESIAATFIHFPFAGTVIGGDR